MWYALLAVALVVTVFLLVRLSRRHAVLRQRIAPAFEIDAEIARTQAALDGLRVELLRVQAAGTANRARLESEYSEAKALYERLGPVIDVEAEVAAAREQVAGLEAKRRRLEEEARRRRTELEQAYAAARRVYDNLTQQVRL